MHNDRKIPIIPKGDTPAIKSSRKNVIPRNVDIIVNDEVWMQRLWDWADEFPRDKQKLLDLKKINTKKRHFSSKKITYLPHEIGRLSQLQWLDLEDNNLSELPPEIVQLSHLQNLFLRCYALLQKRNLSCIN